MPCSGGSQSSSPPLVQTSFQTLLPRPFRLSLAEVPACVLENLLLLRYPRICLKRTARSLEIAIVAGQLLALLPGGPPDGPVDLAEDVRLDGCVACQCCAEVPCQACILPSTQYGHRMWARFTRPQA